MIIAPVGLYAKKDPSDSSASATKIEPLPLCAFIPAVLIVPPIAKDGSRPADCKATVNIAVVVVLPCVPATATDVDSDISHANATARAAIGKPFFLASTNSGLLSVIADETITNWASARFSNAWPTWIFAPNAFNAVSIGDSFLSDPETENPFANIIRAIPLIPAPPTPIKWILSFAKSDNL